jgi:predicted Rossmann fold flavoprotein
MASIFAARGGAPVRLVERTADGGRKILISGGGRCNVLPVALAPERFVTDSPPYLMRAMLRAWPLADQRRFFEEEAGIPLSIEAETGKLFPTSNRARDVRDGLVAIARASGVTLHFGTAVTGLERTAEGWRIDTTAGPLLSTRVILATGGLSVPKTGSDGAGLTIAAALGHTVHDTYPALTPLTRIAATPAPLAPPPAGLSLHARLRARWRGHTTECAGGVLFTHRGFSGPAVLDISHMAVRSLAADDPARILVSWTTRPAREWDADLQGRDLLVKTMLARHLPERLADYLVADAGIPADRRTSSLRRPERMALLERLTAYPLPWSGHEGYTKAEVTGGGVALDEVQASTMESRRHPGLYLCGEILDAFGPIGGHNFVWAWATGRAAGLAAAEGRRNSAADSRPPSIGR